ncbi:hypothetical protein [Arcticibacterium luteifluviistationis]|nr:hypothetical protein [Arcticibacterium luteifluviistationis]
MKKNTLYILGQVKKRSYTRPSLKKLGKVSNLTLKTGSVSDFGSNQFQP